MLFQRRVAKQVGMENYTRIAFCIAMECGGYLEYLSRVD